MSSKRAKLLIASVWILSFLICFPPLVGWNDRKRTFSRQLVNATAIIASGGQLDPGSQPFPDNPDVMYHVEECVTCELTNDKVIYHLDPFLRLSIQGFSICQQLTPSNPCWLMKKGIELVKVLVQVYAKTQVLSYVTSLPVLTCLPFICIFFRVQQNVKNSCDVCADFL